MSRRSRNRNRNQRRMVARVAVRPPIVTVPAFVDCQPTDWVPDVANAHLSDAARGLATLCIPLHAPAPIDFDPPCRTR